MTLPDSISRQYQIPTDHPCFVGHFPDNPIVPGVIILDYTRQLLTEWLPDAQICGIAQAKFHQPLKPEQLFSIILTEKNAHSIKFECTCEAQKIASGLFNIKSLS